VNKFLAAAFVSLSSVIAVNAANIGAANAAVYTENFDNPAFINTLSLGYGSTADSASSDRWLTPTTTRSTMSTAGRLITLAPISQSRRTQMVF